MAIPSDGVESSRAFLSEGYAFISNRCRRLGADAFTTRLMLSRVVCMRGVEAAEIFYDGDRFTRVGAMPSAALKLLQDEGSVQQLDGAAHRRRKAMFVGLLNRDSRVEEMRRLFAEAWEEALDDWQGRREVVFFDEMNALLSRTAWRWAGFPAGLRDPRRTTRELTAQIENAGRFGPRNWRAQRLRNRHERFIRKLVRRIRNGSLAISTDAPAVVVAEYRGDDGKPLDSATAAVEIINMLRPTVAISRFIVFAGLALHHHSEWAARFRSGEEDMLEPFVEEVRRFYPFFPVIGGKVRTPFEWRGRRFAEKDWVLLDLYGTDHDERSFPGPEQFRPERAPSWRSQAFDFVPQGAGDMTVTHRCPGEKLCVALMKEAVRRLARDMEFHVPPQDLSVSLSRMPALPASGLVLTGVRRR